MFEIDTFFWIRDVWWGADDFFKVDSHQYTIINEGMSVSAR